MTTATRTRIQLPSHPDPKTLSNIHSPAVPLWFLAASFWKSEKGLLYSTDWTPVLAVATNPTCLEQAVLILHAERYAPVWYNPSWWQINDISALINGKLDSHESITVSRIIAVNPECVSATLDNFWLHDGMPAFDCALSDRLDNFEHVDTLKAQRMIWLDLY